MSAAFDIRIDPSIADKIETCLTEHNSAVMGKTHQSSVLGAYCDGIYAGGISFRWYGQHASIKKLGIEEAFRKQGLGSQLMRAAEDYLRQQGCRRIYVDTYSFQAPDFYRRHGYQLVATIPDYLEGAEKLYFGKNLTESEAA